MSSAHIPYITLADLGHVLDDCTNRIGLLDDTTRQRILSLCLDFTQERIRTAEATKRANTLRHDTIRELSRLQHAENARLHREQAAIAAEFSNRRSEMIARFDAERHAMTQARLEQQREIQREIDRLSKQAHTYPVNSAERLSLYDQAHEHADRIMALKIRSHATSSEHYQAHARELAELRAAYKAAMDDYNGRIAAAAERRRLTVQSLLNAPVDELPALLATLTTAPQKGGEQ